ncbi:uncharacterized protein LOC122638959 [Telopea speciosissima]|uniref:uncharacterized protein LOC122638959 n=1 Tax=Telopea speciosissima TaxID=54955 RepID=UPI001CC6AE97|nr:uncharacterized protein LOC122638959 [Telopea speciosissima]
MGGFSVVGIIPILIVIVGVMMEYSSPLVYGKKGNVTMRVLNTIGPGTKLHLQCESKDQDLGEKALDYKQEYSWVFADNLGATFYNCDFWYDRNGVYIASHVEVYNPKRDTLCEDCLVDVARDGVYLVNNQHYYAKQIDCFGNNHFKIKELKEELEQLQSLPMDRYSQDKKNAIIFALERELNREEIHWKQKSRIDWLKKGDRNPRFFHVLTLRRRYNNRVLKLKNPDGSWTSSANEMESVLCDHFKDIFKEEPMDISAVDEVLQSVSPVISMEMNEELIRIPCIEEEDIYKFVVNFFKNGIFSPDLNKTLICLIPKVKEADCADLFRPISLCTVMMKLITKLLTARLKKILDMVIDPSQSTFIPGRYISDNILIAHELFHFIKKRKMNTSSQYMAIKLDMRKAYDQVNWYFIERLLLKLSFSVAWVQLVMSCIKSISYSLWSESEHIIPSRGIRQGDPLSPAIFIIYAKALSTIIRSAISKVDIHGIRIRNRGTAFSHLLFADDCFLFCKAHIDEISAWKNILDLYCRASGQEINLKKSSINFSPNLYSRLKRWFARTLKIPYGDGPSKYLGVPTDFGISKKILFQNTKDRTLSKLQGWKKSLLSSTGKEVLLKSSALPMVNFASSHFKLPISLTDEISQASSNFFWEDDSDKSKIHWVSWESMCRSKQKGGLGLRDPHTTKLCWRAKLGHQPSWGWRSLLEGRDHLLLGLIWIVGRGDKISVWNNNWIPSSLNFKVHSLKPENCNIEKVSDLIDARSRCWRLDLINEIFLPMDGIECYSEIRLSLYPHDDKLVWGTKQSGKFSVRSMYHLLNNRRAASIVDHPNSSSDPKAYHLMKEFFWKRIWHAHTLPKIKLFIWKCCADGIVAGVGLISRNIPINPSCQRCGAEMESVGHIFLNCPFSKAVWFGSSLSQKVNFPLQVTMSDWFQAWHPLFSADKKMAQDLFSQASFLLWYIWRARNDIIFKNKPWSPLEVIQMAEKAFVEFQLANNPPYSTHTLEPIRILDSISTHSWIPPTPSWVKLNVDAAWSKGSKKGGLGNVIRNHFGHPFLAYSVGVNCDSAFIAEAVAIRSGLLLAARGDLKKVLVEPDCYSLIQQLSSSDPELAIQSIHHDIVQLQKSFDDCSFSFVPSLYVK